MAEKTQKQKFIDKARELGCDDDEQSFADKLKRIAKAPTPPNRSKTKGKAPAKR